LLLLKKEKPPHERLILEVQHVEAAFEKFAISPECDNALTIEFNTICIATTIFVKCNNPDCEFLAYTPGHCGKTTIHEGDGYERMTDHALNILYVLSFISMGDAILKLEGS
jgi:hypothetical protein